MKKRTAVLAMGIMLIGLTGCGENTSSDGTYTIGISMEDLNTSFCLTNYRAMLDRAEELQNVEIVVSVAQGDANIQNQQIQDFIAQGVDAVVCSPIDNTAIAAVVDECQEEGVPIIMDNRAVAEGSCDPDAQVLSDNKQMAYEEMKWFIEKAKEEGKTYKCLMLIGNLGDGNAVERRDGYQQAIEEFGDGIVEIVVSVPTEWDYEVALSGLQSALAAYPEINMLVLPSDFLWEPVQTALSEIGKWAPMGEENHMVCLSFDGDDTGVQMVEDGYCEANAAQSAVGQGITCIDTAISLIDGEELSERDIKDAGLLITYENYEEVKDQL